jgi:hypothetical protein
MFRIVFGAIQGGRPRGLVTAWPYCIPHVEESRSNMAYADIVETGEIAEVVTEVV